jgi:hypothetical protein
VGDEFGLDGFVTGPDPGPDNGLGTGGEALHTWAFSDAPDDRRLLSEATARSGAVILGRRLFDVVDGPNGWDDSTGYGAGEVGKPAFVVVTSPLPESVRTTSLDWTALPRGTAPIGARAGTSVRHHRSVISSPIDCSRAEATTSAVAAASCAATPTDL